MLEVFASIQGEGRFVGEPQTFVRLRGCPLRCTYCDTPHSWRVRSGDRAEIAAIAPREEPSWASPFEVACWVGEVEGPSPRAVSLTGGEPLEWADFVLELAGMLGRRPLRLETAGVHLEALERVREVVDHVSLDLKLAGDQRPPVPVVVPGEGEDGPRHLPDPGPFPSGAAAWREARREALRLVRGRDACAKLVVTAGSDPAEALAALEDTAELAPEVPVYLQPATPVPGVEAPASSTLSSLLEAALELELAVRLLPQLHALAGWR